jgi:hypothetical protein
VQQISALKRGILFFDSICSLMLISLNNEVIYVYILGGHFKVRNAGSTIRNEEQIKEEKKERFRQLASDEMLVKSYSADVIN